MELKWKELDVDVVDLILAAFLLSKRNPSMAKAGYGSSIRLLLEAIRPAPLRLRPPNASHWQRKGRSQRPFISLPDPRQVAGLNRSSCCNHGPLIHLVKSKPELNDFPRIRRGKSRVPSLKPNGDLLVFWLPR
jgi:hypothetical protein